MRDRLAVAMMLGGLAGRDDQPVEGVGRDANRADMISATIAIAPAAMRQVD